MKVKIVFNIETEEEYLKELNSSWLEGETWELWLENGEIDDKLIRSDKECVNI